MQPTDAVCGRLCDAADHERLFMMLTWSQERVGQILCAAQASLFMQLDAPASSQGLPTGTAVSHEITGYDLHV